MGSAGAGNRHDIQADPLPEAPGRVLVPGGFLDAELREVPAGQRWTLETSAWKNVRSRWYILPMLIIPTLLAAAGFLGGMALYGTRFNPNVPGQILAGLGALFGLVVGLLIFAWVYTRIIPRELWKLAPHLCSGCGYNLTANASGACPECGREIDTQRTDDAGKLSSQ